MPRPAAATVEAFRSLIPDEPTVTSRPMFGNLAAFVNGNMFTGLFGDDLFVRISDEDRERLLKEGGSDFMPMPGRAMRGYVNLPAGWAKRQTATKKWIATSLAFSRQLPPKPAKGAARKR